MAWFLLSGAIVFEVVGTTFMKLSEGFTRLGPSLGVAAGYLGALGLLTLALRTMPVSTAYAVWAGAGTALVAAVGVVLLGEPFSWVKLSAIALIIAGVVVLNLGGAH
ncbi:multidrug efflux SMR transporter [Intrasporangium sp.]|uniref:DMT family transporter n=1 Tax=Intrasporangium sp. TaxID=1925024 RepID=UPI0032220277